MRHPRDLLDAIPNGLEDGSLQCFRNGVGRSIISLKRLPPDPLGSFINGNFGFHLMLIKIRLPCTY